ncbi:carbohydrate porin [Paraburkholderia kururiensis]|uniref:carbohydrate porin n=1 Tax=Paraburkholderia kururiensis TaxID=984307 RepID=UPI0018F2B00B|nr:carbohydrate porin [Paraburkholderia kururiensis]
MTTAFNVIAAGSLLLAAQGAYAAQSSDSSVPAANASVVQAASAASAASAPGTANAASAVSVASTASTTVAGSAPPSAAAATPASSSLLQAQTETRQNPPGVGLPVPSVPPGEGPAARQGPLAHVGDVLEEHGVSLGLLFTNAYFANPSTGISPGKSADYGALFMKATVDLDKLVGIPDTQFNITESWNRPSHNTKTYLFQTGSAFTPFPVEPESTDLVKFTLSHDLFNKRLHIEYGRMNLNDDFMVTTMCSGCVNSTMANVLDAPGVTKSVWGARMAYALSRNTRLGLGVIEDNTDIWQNTTGWDWRTRTRTGWTGIVNVLHETDFSETRYPLKAEAGIYHRTSPYQDALYNVDGSSQALNSSGTPLEHGRGTWGFYGQARKVVWRADEASGPVPRNVALYGGAFITPGPGQSYPIEAYGGAEYGGFLRNNPAAMVGSTVRYIRLSSERALYEQQARAAFTGMLNASTGGAVPVVNEGVARNTFTFDVHGQFGLVPGVLVQGFAQYFLHPNTAVLASVSTTPIRSGWMVGMFLVVDLGRITGLSRP